jgi:hypothetical protein
VFKIGDIIKAKSVQKRKSLAEKKKQVSQNVRPRKNSECELVIGLDFGTSSTKVVIQAPDLPGSPSSAVDFNHYAHPQMPYLMPTRLWVLPDGTCSLENCEGGQMVKDIKMGLIQDGNDLVGDYGHAWQLWSPEEVAACYLAFVLQYSRKWFLETKQDLVGDFSKFIWSVNLGVPSPCVEDNEQNRIFRRVGKAAWMLSTLPEDEITLEMAKRKLRLAEDPEYWEGGSEDTCDFDIIPEIAAGAVGYALSDMRREGLHVIVDIGASTVDVCSFNLHNKEGNDRYSLLIADVQPLGAFRLYRDKLQTIKSTFERHIEEMLAKHDPLMPINLDDSIEAYIASSEQLTAACAEARAKFKEKFLLMMRSVIWQTKCRRDPEATVWQKHGRLPILLIGGGSRLPFFYSAVGELDAWLRKYTSNEGITHQPVLLPNSLVHSAKRSDGHYYLTVTWGLSHRALDVGEIIPADCIPDADPPPRRDWRSRFVSKDQV